MSSGRLHDAGSTPAARTKTARLGLGAEIGLDDMVKKIDVMGKDLGLPGRGKAIWR